MSIHGYMKRGLAGVLLVLLPGYSLPAQHTTASFTQTVTKATPAVGLASTLDPSTYTAPVTFTATVPSNATGAIQFSDGGTALGSPKPVAGGSATLTTASLSVGAHSVEATYSGDSNYNSFASSILAETVDQAASSTTLSSSNTSSSYSAPITFTATVSTPATATGSVNVIAGSQSIGSAPVSGGTASIVTSGLPAGSYSVTAVYSGDVNFTGSTSSVLTETIGQATSVLTLASSGNPSMYSYPVTFTAIMPSAATGNVTFLDGSTSLGTYALASGGVAFTTSVLVAGSHTITASYAGDANYTPVTSSVVTQVVNKDWAISEVSVTPATGVVVGTSLAYTALVDTGSLLPTGTVQFLDGTSVIGSGTVVSASATNLLSYSDNFTQWTPSANVVSVPVLIPNASDGADGSPNTATTVKLPDTSATGVQGADFSGISQNASGSYSGKTVTFSVWVSSPTAATVVLVLADGSAATQNSSTCNAIAVWQRCNVTAAFASGAASGLIASIRSWGTAAETVSLYGAQVEVANAPGVYVRTTGAATSGVGGVATFTGSLLEGTHSITTTYSGDSNYLGSNSVTLPVTVGAGTAAITLTSSNLNSNYGQSVTFTSTLTATSIMPTGVVTFLDGATVLGTGAVDGTGKAALTLATLTGGSHSITASYGGDGEYRPVVSSAITQTVALVAPVITVVSSNNPSVYGDSVTFTLTATGVGIVPTGTLTLTDGATTLSVLTLNASGIATYTTSTLTAGTHDLLVTYSGDSNYK